MGGPLARSAAPVVLAALLCAACGSSPTTPPPPPPPAPTNNPPVIGSFVVQGTRAPKEPANFADVGEAVPVSATVHDDDTPAAQLEYQWSATAGTFSGAGASVTWTAPQSVTGPVDVTITLKVIDHYGFAGQPPAFTQSVSGTTRLSLHDSATEVGTMARQFLLDFSDSSIPVAVVMRNFDSACTAEFDDVNYNRAHLRIVGSSIGQPSVVIPFGNAFCTGINQADHTRVQHGDACSGTPSHWESILLDDGSFEVVDGTDWITGFYKPDLRAWKLCDSQFTGTCRGCSVRGLSIRKFFR